VGLAVFVIVLLDFWSVKFLRTWLRVKMSRGQLILLRVNMKVQDIYRVGKIEEGFLVFKGSGKGQRRIALPNDTIFRSMGVNCAIIDDEKNCVVKINFEAVSGFDAEKFDDLLTRALYKPSILDDKTKIIIIILVVLVLAVGFGFYLTHGWINEGDAATNAKLDALIQLLQASGQLGSQAVSGAVSG
jgi:hypothetical protein